jgi:formylglycine-generating enzyme required for sulfatase activity
MTIPVASAVDRQAAVDAYRRNRERSREIFDLIDPAAYYSRPIALRNPIVFYEGHLPAFSVIAFLRRGLGRPPVDRRLEDLFARGIDPDSEQSAVPRSGASTSWPSREEVRAFGDACDAAVLRALEHDAWPAEGVFTALEHEAMHQETLLYMWHRLPYDQKRPPSRFAPRRDEPAATPWLPPSGGSSSSGGSSPARGGAVLIPAGHTTLGASRDEVAFGWDNEFERHVVHVPEFDIDVLPVTNAQFLEFIDAGGYQNRPLWDDEGWEWVQKDRVQHPAFWLPSNQPRASALRASTFALRATADKTAGEPSSSPEPPTSDLQPPQWLWRGMFEAIPLPPSWPVYVSQAEASAYARWKGRRLMTEAEFHRAAYGTASGRQRVQPWGDEEPDAARGHFDFAGFDPVPVGSHPSGASAWGVQELVGNGWEWTSTIFAPFEGFTPMPSYPEYSADFFDGRHYVMKGASPATARALVRRSFRNWFRGNYPYVYAKFRTVK